MAREDTDLEQLSTMLRQCLGRIDEEAFRLQESDGEPVDFGEADRLEASTFELQDLVESLLVVEASEEADVNEVVASVASARLQEVSVPLVQQLRLSEGCPRAAVSRSILATAVDRALSMAVGTVRAGGQLNLSTRVERDAVVLEVECLGCDPEDGAYERAETLRDFVKGFGGSCTARCEQEDLFFVLEVPRVNATEPSDRG